MDPQMPQEGPWLESASSRSTAASGASVVPRSFSLCPRRLSLWFPHLPIAGISSAGLVNWESVESNGLSFPLRHWQNL